MIDETEVRRWWDTERHGDMLTEIRLISPEGKIGSGYFKNIDNLLAEIKKYPGYGVYHTINQPEEAVYERMQREKICFRVKSTTQDKEIKRREEVVIDLDPVRVSGTNSTEEELGFAKKKANEIYKWLQSQGFYPALANISANGCHLRLRCAMKNDDETTEMVKKFLGVIDMLFSDEKVDCDTTLYNASRILKVCGTMSFKGNDDPNSARPRRMCRYTKIPDDWFENVNRREYFEKVAAMFPEPEQPNRSNNYNPRNFNIEDFIKEHNIEVLRTVKTAKMTKFLLKSCPWGGESHGGGSAALFLMPDGSCGFKCQHASCSHHNIKDFRLFYAPDSFTKRDYSEYMQRQRYYGAYPREEFQRILENPKDGKIWLSLKDVKYVDLSQVASLNTGYIELDRKLSGLLLGDVTVLSGSSGAGKTSWLDCVLLNCCNRGVKCAVWSGEFQAARFSSWIDTVAAGKSYTRKKDGYDCFYYCPQPIAEKINNWLDGKLFLYNNNYKNKAKQLLLDIEDVIEKEKVELICLDNLAAMSLVDFSGQKYDQQTQLITELKELAKAKNVSIILVCHPRKTTQFLRKEDISGTADLVNLCDNLFLLHRVGKDFKERATEFLGASEVDRLAQYDSIIEVAKNRHLGIVDYFVGMYFEPESRRLKNDRAEHIVYGWEEQPISQPLFSVQPTPSYEMDSPFNSASPTDPFGQPTDETAPF